MTQFSKLQFFLFSIPIALLGVLNDYAYYIIIAEVLFSLLCIYSDYSKGAKSINFLTIYSAFTLTYCYGNFLVVLSIGTPEESVFNYYLVHDTITEALFFTYIANVFCVLGFTYYDLSLRKSTALFKTMNIDISLKIVRYILLAVTVLNVAVLFRMLNYTSIFPFLIGSLFFLTRYASRNSIKWIFNFCVFNTVLLSLNGLMFDYLRMSTIGPGIAFVIAVFFGGGTISVLLKKSLFPIYLLLAFSILIFPIVGQIRTSQSGVDKFYSVISKLQEEKDAQASIDLYEAEDESFEARVSNINQTSQIVKLINDVGYYNGSTLGYLAFAFIPRFIWKEKPIIAQGVWFALEIGQAYQHADGKVNNSVNMTSAGELYLNFGIIGVMVGMFLIGMLCAFMWGVSGFSESESNLLGAIFGLYLFFLATSTFGIDLQFLVTLLSYFLMFQFVNYTYRFFIKPNELDRV